MVWRVIGTLAFIITGAQLVAVRRMLARPVLPRRRGGHRGDETISRSLLASPDRDGSAMTLWPELVLPTLSPGPAVSASSSSVGAGRPAAGNVSPVDVLDTEALVALTGSRLDVDDLVARHRKIKPADLPGDLPYAVLHCCAAWMQRFAGTRPTAIGSGDFRQQVRGLLMIGCATGAVAGLAMRDLPVDGPKAADRKELIRSGLRRAAATTSIDTLELLTRSRDLDAVATHVADWARTLADRSGVTIADSESFAAICELAFADGVYLGLTAPSPTRHDF
jgi:hypothetical protein